jgi:esterase/lipase superfamily enzyme
MRIAFVIFAAAGLAGCMLPRPLDSQAYVARCEIDAEPPDEALLFVTLRLPDCRSDPFVMTWHRGLRPMYGAKSGTAVRFYSPAKWDAALTRRLGAKPALIYVHGYNNDNADALGRAEAISTAIAGSHEVVAITWPSYKRVTKYFWDEANAEWSFPEARRVFERITASPGRSILVAHSMGNRVALDMVQSWRSAHRPQPLPLERLIMASPDVDRASVIEQLSDGLGVPVTLYGSTRDQPLSASWRSHGYPRAGDFSSWVTGHVNVYPFDGVGGVDVVDTSAVSHGALGHADFIESREGAADLCRVINRAPTDPGRQAVAGHPNAVALIRNPPAGDACAGQGEAAAESLK